MNAAQFSDHSEMVGAIYKTNNARVLLLLGVLAVIPACHKDPGATPATPQVKLNPKPTKPGPTAATLTAGMVEAAGEGKAQAAVDLKFEVTQKPKVGQALEINLALLPKIDAAMATIQVTGADGFTVGGSDAKFDIAGIVAGNVYRHALMVTPTSEGVLVLGITLLLKTDDNTETRAFAIPIIADR